MAGTSLSQQPAGLRTLAAGPVLACAAILAALPLGPSTAASGHSGAAGGSARVPASFRRAAGNAAGSTARPRASYVGAAEARLAAVPGQGLGATDALPRPSWWHGSCDGGQGGAYPGSRPNSARFDGLVSCGPGRNQGGEDHLVQFYPGAWGEYEWECVELSMRFMLEAWGVPPYPADGNDVVANYPDGAPGYPGLQKVGNGTVGRPPEPGDVLSIKDGDSFGHTEVVASTDVNGAGNGTIRAIAENWTEHMSGFVNLFVSHWVVSDGVAGNKVLGWLHNPSWSLELPVLWAISSSGNLEIKSSGTLGGSWTTVAADISAARVAGGGGSDPSPLVAGLTTSGTLEAGPLAYDTALSPVASGVAPGPRSFAISSGWGMRGRPLLAYVTRSGALELVSGSLRSAPVTLLGGDVRQVVVAAGSGPGNAFIGILTDAGHFEVAEGAVSGPLAWQSVASGVSAIALAGGGESSADALVAFIQHGRVFEREGPAGAFDLVGTGVRALALASVGPSAVPLVAEVTGGGDLEISLGAQVPVLVATSVATVSLDAGPTQMGFPVLAYLSSNHEMSASDGRLDSSPRQEATGVMSMGAAALTVS